MKWPKKVENNIKWYVYHSMSWWCLICENIENIGRNLKYELKYQWDKKTIYSNECLDQSYELIIE